MNDDLHDIDDLFKKALEQHTELPSSAAWDNIDKSLDKKRVVSISKKYNKLKWAAVILLLFSLGMAMYILHTGMENKELVKENNRRNGFKNQPNKNVKDSVTEVKKVILPTENAKISEEGKKQENKNTASVVNNNKIDLPEDKNTAENVKPGNSGMRDNTPKQQQDNEKTGDTSKQPQEPSILKTGPAIKPGKVQKNPGLPGYKNPGDSIINTTDTRVPGTIKKEEKSLDNISETKEKYIAEIQAANEYKDSLELLVIKPLSPVPVFSSDKTMALKYNKAARLKHTVKKENGSLLSATIFFSPDLVSTDVRDGYPRFREDNRHEIEQDEKIKSSSTLGVLIDYNAGRKWIVESGLTFSTRNNYIQPKTIYARPDNNGNINYRFNCSAGYSFISVKSAALPGAGDSISTFASKNTLKYIGVPLVLKYMVGKGRFSITPGVGLSANFLTKGKIQTTIATTTGDEGAASNDILGLRSMYFNGSASVGVEYKLNKRFALAFVPTVRFALSSINKDAPVKTNLNSIGLAAGATIKF